MNRSFRPVPLPADTRPGQRRVSALEATVAPAKIKYRVLIEDIAAWAETHDRPVDHDVLALVLLGRERLERWFTGIETRGHYWTRKQVNHLISIDIPNVCALNALDRPDNYHEHVWLLLGHLAEAGFLHFDSDSIDQLRAPLRCFGELDAEGRPRARSVGAELFAGDESSDDLEPCRCYWPTRKQLELRLEENPPVPPSQFDWYEPERRTAADEWEADADWMMLEGRTGTGRFGR